MTSIYKRKNSKGWRAVVRIKGYPTVCNHFDRKKEAEDWAREAEREIKLGRFKSPIEVQSYGVLILHCVHHFL